MTTSRNTIENSRPLKVIICGYPFLLSYIDKLPSGKTANWAMQHYERNGFKKEYPYSIILNNMDEYALISPLSLFCTRNFSTFEQPIVYAVFLSQDENLLTDFVNVMNVIKTHPLYQKCSIIILTETQIDHNRLRKIYSEFTYVVLSTATGVIEMNDAFTNAYSVINQ